MYRLLEQRDSRKGQLYFLIYKRKVKSLLLVFSSPEREERGRGLTLINMDGPAGRLIFFTAQKNFKIL